MAPNDLDFDRLARAVQDAANFTVLTESTSSATGSPSLGMGGGNLPGLAPLGSLVTRTMHEVLQWRPSRTDVRGLKEALTASFNSRELQGRTVYSHVPRSYIMQVQADGGAVTGAQASIHTRAQAAVNQSLPLLEGLYPLDSESDREDLAAVRATIRLALSGLVEELARGGGPRVQRVDTLFALLLGEDLINNPPPQFDLDAVGGQLGLLRDRLGLSAQRVNNAEEEKNLTNFLILVDHVFTLWLSWKSLRTYFDRTGGEVFLGPQLVLLSRALRVVAESVRETYTLLDSVFIGPAEREITRLDFSGGQPPMTIAELLEWVDSFASSEGPQLISEAGKDGVIALRSTLNQLTVLVEEAVTISGQPSSNPSPGFHSGRINTALRSLLLPLKSARDLAAPLSRQPQPKVFAIDPEEGEAGDAGLRMRVQGKGFHPEAEVFLTRAISPTETETLEAENVHFVSETALWVIFDLAGAAPGTVWTVGVRNPDGVEGRLPVSFTVDDGQSYTGGHDGGGHADPKRRKGTAPQGRSRAQKP